MLVDLAIARFSRLSETHGIDTASPQIIALEEPSNVDEALSSVPQNSDTVKTSNESMSDSKGTKRRPGSPPRAAGDDAAERSKRQRRYRSPPVDSQEPEPNTLDVNLRASNHPATSSPDAADQQFHDVEATFTPTARESPGASEHIDSTEQDGAMESAPVYPSPPPSPSESSQQPVAPVAPPQVPTLDNAETSKPTEAGEEDEAERQKREKGEKLKRQLKKYAENRQAARKDPFNHQKRKTTPASNINPHSSKDKQHVQKVQQEMKPNVEYPKWQHQYGEAAAENAAPPQPAQAVSTEQSSQHQTQSTTPQSPPDANPIDEESDKESSDSDETIPEIDETQDPSQHDQEEDEDQVEYGPDPDDKESDDGHSLGSDTDEFPFDGLDPNVFE